MNFAPHFTIMDGTSNTPTTWKDSSFHMATFSSRMFYISPYLQLHIVSFPIHMSRMCYEQNNKFYLSKCMISISLKIMFRQTLLGNMFLGDDLMMLMTAFSSASNLFKQTKPDSFLIHPLCKTHAASHYSMSKGKANQNVMTSWHGNAFSGTGPLWGASTVQRRIPLTRGQ